MSYTYSVDSKIKVSLLNFSLSQKKNKFTKKNNCKYLIENYSAIFDRDVNDSMKNFGVFGEVGYR